MIKVLSKLLLLSLRMRIRGQRPTHGFADAVSRLKIEAQIYLCHRNSVDQLVRTLTDRGGLRLNLGCGANLKPDWINVDLGSGTDLSLDLREPIPLPDSSCSFIYSEHFFEHIDWPTPAEGLLRDYFRLLHSGGRLSIGVPDGELSLRAYAGDDPQQFFAISKERWHPKWANTRMEQINYQFRQGGEHRFIYDQETLEAGLAAAGFVEIHRREYDPSLDSPERAWGTLYVDGIRP